MAPNNSHRLKARRIKIPRGQRVEIFVRREKGNGNADMCLVGPCSISLIITKVEKGEKKERTQED